MSKVSRVDIRPRCTWVDRETRQRCKERVRYINTTCYKCGMKPPSEGLRVVDDAGVFTTLTDYLVENWKSAGRKWYESKKRDEDK